MRGGLYDVSSMTKAPTVTSLLATLPEDRVAAMKKLRSSFRKHLPEGFKEVVQGNMIAYVVPHKIYPDGYHCDPEAPLPFISVASQKNFIAVYHMGMYADPKLLAWFEKEWPKYVKTKLDMGKSCVRLKKIDTIPFELFAELATKVTVKNWVATYEKSVKR
jgi:hypothetical protein